MFDINAIVTSAIAKEVNLIIEPLTSRITKLEESNAVLLKALVGGQPTPSSGSVTVDTFPELFAVEFNRKVGGNDVLSREEVAEIVKELWSEDYEQEVQDMIDRSFDDHDFDDQIRSALRNASITIDV